MYYLILAAAVLLQPAFSLHKETFPELKKEDKAEIKIIGKFKSEEIKEDYGKLETQRETLHVPESTANKRQFFQSGQEVYDDDGWTIIQRNFHDDKLDFNLNWQDYKLGFGDLRGDFWFGLENIYQLTFNRRCKLRIELWDFNDYQTYAEYSDFYIDGESENYRLHVIGHTGTATDKMIYHNNMSFSTKDRDNDQSSIDCATGWLSGWWYDDCQYNSCALNGFEYYDGDPWWNGRHKNTMMKFRCN